MFLTTTDAITNAIADGLQAAATLVAISWIIGLGILILTVAIITWVVKLVWNAGSNRKYKRQQRNLQIRQREWDTWYSEQAKRTNQVTNQAQGYVKNGVLYSPTGWRWDEEAKLWVPPEKTKK